MNNNVRGKCLCVCFFVGFFFVLSFFYTRFSSTSVFVSVQNISTSVHNKSWKIHYSPSGLIKIPSVLLVIYVYSYVCPQHFPQTPGPSCSFHPGWQSWSYASLYACIFLFIVSLSLSVLFFFFCVLCSPLSAPRLLAGRVFLWVLVLRVPMGVEAGL